jgi:hypothetical protein
VAAERRAAGQIALNIEKNLKAVWSEATELLLFAAKAARPVAAERRAAGQIAHGIKKDLKAVWSEATELFVLVTQLLLLAQVRKTRA